jgi:hypothetical protein
METKKNVSLIHQLRKTIDSLNLNMMHQRKFIGILNALEMQVEDGDFDKEVIDCLCNAIQWLGKRYKVEPMVLSAPIEKLVKALTLK